MAEAEAGSQHPDYHSEKRVRSPNLINRAKEEMEAVFHHVKETHNGDLDKDTPTRKSDCAKENVEAVIHQKKTSLRHKKETHGMSDDIDESTPIEKVKGPNLFQRVKEEVEAIVEAIHPKKGLKDHK